MPPRESQEYWDAIRRSQKAVREVLKENISTSLPPNDPQEKAVPVITFKHGEVAWAVMRGYKLPFEIKFIPIAESRDDYLSWTIPALLDGLSEDAIRVCPGCKKFFFNPTKREKRFCSARCMSKVLTRERRQADRDAYNEYQKKLMKDRRKEESRWSPPKKTKARKGVSASRNANEKKGKGD